MSWKNVKLILQREIRDQFRDRRTLFMVAILPLLLYPALGFVLMNMTVSLATQVQRVAFVGVEEMPNPPLIQNGQLEALYFDDPTEVDKFELYTDQMQNIEIPDDPDLAEEIREFFREVEVFRPEIARLARIQNELDQRSIADPGGYQQSSRELIDQEKRLRQEIDAWFADAPVQVLVLLPEGFRAEYDAIGQALQGRAGTLSDLADLPRSVILYNSASERGMLAYQRIRSAVRRWDETLLVQRLEQSGLPSSFPEPLPLTSVDLAEAEQIAANVWSKMFPTLLVIMAVTGAFYPAVDLGAGEKERGTMETLLISPATRGEIVVGKFLTVMAFSFLTAMLNLASMGFTGLHMATSLNTVQSSPLGDLTFPPWQSLLWVVLLAIPIAALFSALSLALAMFARSSKEGQYYLNPLLLGALGMALFCLYPGVELTPYFSLLPVIGPNLLLKALLLGEMHPAELTGYTISVLMASSVYSGLALWWAIDQFQREDILFREAERFDIRIWIRHLLREKEPTPSFSEAGVCFIIVAMLQYIFLLSMQGAVGIATSITYMVTVQLIFLIATVGVPPMFMALLLTSSVKKTLKLSLPNWRYLVVGGVLAFTLMPVMLELLTRLDRFFPPVPDSVAKLMAGMGDAPLWLSFAAFAIAPAVCEELAFRGFILSGLQRSRHQWLPIVISALLFGIIHVIPKQQFNASLLGLVLGLLAVRSQSLYPSMLFHVIFNGIQVLASQVSAESLQGTAIDWLVYWEGSGATAAMRFRFVTVLAGAIISAFLLVWLLKAKPHGSDDPDHNDPFPSHPSESELSEQGIKQTV